MEILALLYFFSWELSHAWSDIYQLPFSIPTTCLEKPLPSQIVTIQMSPDVSSGEQNKPLWKNLSQGEFWDSLEIQATLRRQAHFPMFLEDHAWSWSLLVPVPSFFLANVHHPALAHTFSMLYWSYTHHFYKSPPWRHKGRRHLYRSITS